MFLSITILSLSLRVGQPWGSNHLAIYGRKMVCLSKEERSHLLDHCSIQQTFVQESGFKTLARLAANWVDTHQSQNPFFAEPECKLRIFWTQHPRWFLSIFSMSIKIHSQRVSWQVLIGKRPTYKRHTESPASSPFCVLRTGWLKTERATFLNLSSQHYSK